MRTAKVTHKSISPFQFNAPVRPEEISGETKDQQEERTWRDKAHTDQEGNVFIPPRSIPKCSSECSKIPLNANQGQGEANLYQTF